MDRYKSLLIFIFFSLKSVFAFDCYVVSDFENFKGNTREFALKHMPLLHTKTSIINGQQCVIVNSWDNLKSSIEKHSKKDSELVIYQGSHGGPGGKIYINNETVPGEKILTILNDLSDSRKVFAALESCHSGDILKMKIRSDSLNSNSTKNLCLFTSSNFLEKSYGIIQNESNISKTLVSDISGFNAEEVIINLGFGLISSAPWNEITNYLNERTVENAFEVFKLLEFSERILYCHDESVKGALLPLDANISDEDILLFKNPDKFTPKFVQSELLSWLDDLRKRDMKGENKLISELLNSLEYVIDEDSEDLSSDLEMFYNRFKRKHPNLWDKLVSGNLAPKSEITQLKILSVKNNLERRSEIVSRMNDYLYKKNRPTENTLESVERKQKVLESFLGEFNDMLNGEKNFYYKDELSRVLILGGTKIEKLESDLDRLRRNACRDFKFK